MSTTTASRFESTGSDTRHCKEDALSDREFERLVEASYRLDEQYYALEARFIVFAAGRLGLRSGEITHMTEEWVDRQRKMIQIPSHERCDKGRGGGICGHCEQAAKQIAEYNDDVTLTQAREWMWSPKTPNSAREVPYNATTRAAIAVEDYFDRFDRFSVSQTGVNRRVKRAAELAEGLDADDVYPHCLRATTASFFAARGLNSVALKGLMGWADFSVALDYIEDSGERTSRALDSIVG